MPYIRVASNINVADSLALSQLGATANGTANSEWFAELSLAVSLPVGHGGLKFNLRLPTGSFAELSEGFTAQHSEHIASVMGIPWAGVNVNLGAVGAAIDYLMWDPPGAWVGIIRGQWSVKLGGSAGPGAIDVARVRTGGPATVIKTGSILSLRSP